MELHFLHEWSAATDQDEAPVCVTSVTWTGSDKLAVADQANCVVKLMDVSGAHVTSLGRGKLKRLGDVISDSAHENAVLAADMKLGCIKRLMPHCDMTLPTEASTRDVLRRPCRQPSGLALAPDGSLIVADVGEKAVLWLPRHAGSTNPLHVDGIRSLSLEAEFRWPTHVCSTSDDSVLVSDARERAVTLLRRDGVVCWRSTSWQRPAGLAAVGSQFVVADALRGAVCTVGSDNTVTSLVVGLYEPVSLAPSTDGATVVIAESDGAIKFYRSKIK